MKQTLVTFAAVYALIIGATSCNNANSISTPTIASQTPAPAGATTYTQIERLARPAVKEALQSYDNHDTTARSSPYNDPKLPGDIVTFMTQTAGRSQATANTLQSVLIPDETAFDLSQSGQASYLGVETGGFTGGKFGGRALSDDVIDIDLGAIFGPTLSALKLVADDGKSIPCLTTDNVPTSSQARPTNVFPYLNSPN